MQWSILYGLNFTDSTSAANWAGRSVENYATLTLPKIFEELQQIPLDRKYNFLMSFDKTSMDKEIQRLGVEALMFWELPKVETALNDMCQKWFFNYSETYVTETIDISAASKILKIWLVLMPK